MKHFIKLFIVFCLLLFTNNLFSQVTVAGSTSCVASYLTLTAAFSAINAATVQSGKTILITITANTNEPTTTGAILNAGNWTSLKIIPNGNITITALTTAGISLITLNGAKNVTIDGNNSLTINNDQNTSAVNGSAAIKFINGASNNIIKNCTIKGAGLTPTETGVLSFSTSTTTGNNNNIIENCEFQGSSVRPLIVISSIGSTGKENSGNIIRNNKFNDCLKNSGNTYGIKIGLNSTDFTISGNSFYQTTDMKPPSGYCISIDNTSGNNFTITDNKIGGSLANFGWMWTKLNNSNTIFYGIYLNVGSTTTTTLNNNTIKNFNYTNSAEANFYGIYIAAGKVDVGTTTGNTISNIAFNSVGGSFYGIYNKSNNASIAQNTIKDISTSIAASTTNITGIYNEGNTSVYQNNISNFTATTAETTTIKGIEVNGGTSSYYNNMITLGNGLSNSFEINGINETVTGGTNNFYFNSIYIGGTSVGGSNNTFAFKSIEARNYKNNIFYNARSNGAGSGKHYAVAYGGTTANPVGLSSDYNIYYANGTGGVLGYYNSTDVTTLQALRYNVGQDLHSAYANPYFIDATASTPNLHLSPITPAEGSGIAIANYTTDFDGEARTNDIGADAGNFTLDDKFTPNFIFTPLSNGASSYYGNRNFKATITDIGAGIDNSSFKPRVWYKKQYNGAWNSTEGTLNSGTTNNGTWIFTINYAAIGDAIENDSIYYYIVAQDAASPMNIWSSCFDATTPSHSNVLTNSPPPNNSVLYAYKIIPSFEQPTDLTVCNSGCDYTSLSTLFGDINNKCIPYHLRITVKSDLTESVTSLLENVTMNNYDSYIKIISDGTTRTINAATNPSIKINNSEGVIFDGGVAKNLIFNNTSTNSVFQFSNGAKNCEINNCVIESNAGTNGAINIGSGENILIENNKIKENTSGYPNTCIYLNSKNTRLIKIKNNEIANWIQYGVNAYQVNDNISIEGNHFYTNQSYGTQYGIKILRESTVDGKGHLIKNNFIGGQTNSCGGTALTNSDGTFYGIHLDVGSTSASIIEGNIIKNISLTKSFGPSNFSGIYVAAGQGNRGLVEIKNNIIGENSKQIIGYASGNYHGIDIQSKNPNNLVESNTISNIIVSNAGIPQINGIIVNVANVKKNKIYKLGTSISSNAGIFGINLNTNIDQSYEVSNNQIALDGIAASNPNYLIGIYNQANSNGIINCNYNSIYIYGTATSSNNSGALYRANFSNNFKINNNIIINSRSGGSGAHFALGTQSPTGWISNYNFIAASNSAKTFQFGSGSTYQDIATWKTAGRDNSSWIATIGGTTDYANINPSDLFTDAANGDLSIKNNAAAWYVYGKGIAGSTSNNISTDLSNNARSTTYGMATCIGANQFTINETTNPPISANASTVPSAGTTTTYTFGNRTICSIDWATASNVPTSMEVKYFSGVNPPSPTPATAKYNNYYVKATATGGTTPFNYTMNLSYDEAFQGTFNTLSSARLSKYDFGTSFWTTYTASTNLSGASNPYIISVSGLTSFSGFTGADFANPLPIELISFEGKCNNNNAILSWSTASELNNDYFTLENSSNNRNWKKINVIKGKENSTTNSYYQYIDNNFDGNTNYYRLSQTDFDGSITYFNPIHISCIKDIENETNISIYPNPIKEKLNVSIISNDKTPFNISVYNFNGSKVLELNNIILNDNQFIKEFDISFLPKGIYFIKIIGNNFDESQKIIKD